MKYALDCGKDVQSSMLFWLARFVKFKLSSLSNKELRDPQALAKVNYKLSRGISSIDELDGLVKMARNAGLTGVSTYFNPLKKFYDTLLFYDLSSLKQIDEELISEILASISGGLSDASRKNYRISVINFFSFLDKQNEEDGKAHVYDITLKNWQGIAGSRGQKLPEYMSEEELSRFLAAIDNTDFKLNTNRNRLILKLIIFTGIRVGEALNLKRKDLSAEGELYHIRIRAKGNKYRVVMIKRHLIDELLKNIAINYINKEGYLFINKKGERLTQAYVSRIVEQVLFKAGIRKAKNGAHMLRHTFATMLYKHQKDLVLVQETLGHANLNTSRIYTHFDNEKLKVAAAVAEELASGV